MEYRFTSSPRVPADPALPQTAEEEDAEEDAEESDDSDLEYIRLEWERMEYIRCHRLPTDYFDGWTSEELQGFDDALRGEKRRPDYTDVGVDVRYVSYLSGDVNHSRSH